MSLLSVIYFISYFFLAEILAEDGQVVSPREQRGWSTFEEPYQQRYVTLLPPSLSNTNYDQSIAHLWPPIPQVPAPWTYNPPSPIQYSQPQPSPPIINVLNKDSPQEQSSHDLDVGLYTGIDSPWTQLPPFTKSFTKGPIEASPWTQIPTNANYFNPPGARGGPLGGDIVNVGGENKVGAWWWGKPWMMKQGGFQLTPDDDQVKLTMHIPKDGLPGGVLVMELKASIYRPVY